MENHPNAGAQNRILDHPFILITVVDFALLMGALANYGQSVHAVQAMTRLTARVSLVVFCLVFSASSWHRLAPSDWSTSLLRKRRTLGLAFAYAHTIHLAFILLFFWLAQKGPSTGALILGGGAYLIMYVLALTSNDWSVKKLGPQNWKRLHRFGVYYIWLVFFLTYLMLILSSQKADGSSKPSGSLPELIVGIGVVVALILLRIFAAVYVKRGAVCAD